VVELRGSARFLEEAFPHALAVDEPGEHHLDGDLAIEVQVVGEEDSGHAAASELALDVVFAECGLAEFLEQLNPRIE
jgi:hypothetical protein